MLANDSLHCVTGLTLLSVDAKLPSFHCGSRLVLGHEEESVDYLMTQVLSGMHAKEGLG